MQTEPLGPWGELVAAIEVAVESECGWNAPLNTWRKAPDGSLVTDLDLRLDVAIRSALRKHYPEVPVLSEELGVLRPADAAESNTMIAVIDPIDGTESLLDGNDSWWASMALLVAGVPIAGLIVQPTRGAVHDSMQPDAIPAAPSLLGMSPDFIGVHAPEGNPEAASETGGNWRPLTTLAPVPHSVEKIAAVIEGRCEACAFVPSKKSPGWHSWDVAAGIAVAQAYGAFLLDGDGEKLRLDDLSAYQEVPWICARDMDSWEAGRASVAGWLGDR